MTRIFSDPSLSLFLILILGIIISKISIKGISLGSASIVFAALIAGHLGAELPPIIESVGLILFIFSVGIQAGPGFFTAFKNGDIKQFILPLLLVFALVSSATIVFCKLFHFDSFLTAGLFSGLMTSTATLAAVVETGKNASPILAYTISYPIAMLVTIITIRLIPRLLKIDIQAEVDRYRSEQEHRYPKVHAGHFIVTNHKVDGRALKTLSITSMTGAQISRIQKSNETDSIIPNEDVVLHLNDHIKGVGSDDALNKLELLIGDRTYDEIAITQKEEVRWILVSKSDSVGKRLIELNLDGLWGAHISKINRSGIEIVPQSHTKLRFGDKVLATASRDTMPNLVTMLGGVEEKEIDFLPIAVSVVIGILVGQIHIPLGTITVSPGIAGGILLTTLILGNMEKTGPLLWCVAGPVNRFLRQLGLMFFLCGIGTRTGKHLAESLSVHALTMALFSAVITAVALILALWISAKFTRINRLKLLGVVAASFTCAPALAAIAEIDDASIAETAYSVAFPFALFLTIIVGQLILFI